MKNRIRVAFWGFCFLGSIVLSGCSAKKISVLKTPTAHIVYSDQERMLLSGYPNETKPWIVYAMKDNVALYPREKSQVTNKSMAFLTPFVILKQKGTRFKVAQYEVGSVVNHKVEQKKIKEQGWVNREDVLLWTASLRDATTGFTSKGILAIQDKSVLPNLEKYIENDSLLLFKDPGLQSKIAQKIALNSLVYLYAWTADKKKAFIGESASIEEGTLEQQRFGWVDARMVGIWGERTAFRVKATTEDNPLLITVENGKQMPSFTVPIVRDNAISDSANLGNLYPLHYQLSTDEFKVKYLDQVLDYGENQIFNVIGQPLFYKTYRNILTDNRKLNLIFIVDGSKEVEDYLTPLNTIFQDLGLQFASHSYFNSISYTTLFYHIDKRNKYNANAQLLDFETWSNTRGKPLTSNLMPSTISAFGEVFEDVDRLLINKENQSNLFVVVGQRLTMEDQLKQKEIVEKITRTGGRVIFYQVFSTSSDSHNDFVLTAEELIKTSADQIAERKKQLLVDYQGVVSSSIFDVSLGNQGVYQLDYPEQSMHQGAVIFPRKGEENKPALLQSTLAKMIRDITIDNQRIDSSLTVVFNSDLGVTHTKIKTAYSPMYQNQNTSVSISIAKQLVNQDYAFMLTGMLRDSAPISVDDNREYGVFVSQDEMEQLQQYYRNIHKYVLKKGHLNKRRMIRRYITAARKNSITPKKMRRKFWRSNPIAIGLFHQTGLYLTTSDTLAKESLNQWKNNKLITTQRLINFFESFKKIADKIKNKIENQEAIIQEKGGSFYWLDQSYIPILDYNIDREENEIDDLASTEQKRIQAFHKQTTKSKKYFKRVNKGMP